MADARQIDASGTGGIDIHAHSSRFFCPTKKRAIAAHSIEMLQHMVTLAFFFLFASKRMGAVLLRTFLLVGGLLEGQSSLLTHGRNDSDKKILAIVKGSLNLSSDITLRNLDIILLVSISSDHVQVAVVNVDELVFVTADVGDIHVVGGGRDILELLAGEDVNGDQVNLGVTVLASLGGRHVDNLAGAALDHNMSVLAKSRALHRVGERRASTGGLEGVLFVLLVVVVSHGECYCRRVRYRSFN